MMNIDRDTAILIGILLLAIGAAYNAQEAHRHTHELACKVEHSDLCYFARKH